MIYFANPCTPRVVGAMQRGELGFIATPTQGNVRPAGIPWIADNGCFGKGYPGDAAFLRWLREQGATDCRFAVAPDVVGDWEASWPRSRPFVDPIRRLGYQVAIVAQDGMRFEFAPWECIDALFIGGTTSWKLGTEARWLVRAAHKRRKWVHMGRVNTWSRLQYARDIGCDSVDGTFLTFGPDKNLPRLRGWLKQIDHQMRFA